MEIQCSQTQCNYFLCQINCNMVDIILADDDSTLNCQIYIQGVGSEYYKQVDHNFMC